jgi:serine/threonine-protein kinase RsbW
MSQSGPQSEPDGLSFELTIESDPATLAPVRKSIELLCARAGFEPEQSAEVGLSVNEALANIIRHAYNGRTDRPIAIAAQARDGKVTIRLRDWGSGVVPPDPPPQNDPLKPGGLGLVCMTSLMDTIQYLPQRDGMVLVMSRVRSTAQGSVT